MYTSWIQAFVKSAGIILLTAASERLLIAIGSAQYLSLPDAALGIPLRYAILTVGGIELLVALICLFNKRVHLQIAWLSWLATDFVVFRAGLLWMNCHPQATCIGPLTDPLHLARGAWGLILTILSVYVVLGSYLGLVFLLLDERSARLRSRNAEFVKIFCFACGGHIKFNVQNLGQIIPCPHCNTAITLRKPEECLKMSCFFCHEHIEFPVHALGRKIKCPHCDMEVGLRESS